MSKRNADAIEETERDSDYQLAIRPIIDENKKSANLFYASICDG